jgi:hypothetical protein
MGKNKGLPKKKNQVLDHALGQQLINSMKTVGRVKVEGEGPREGYRIVSHTSIINKSTNFVFIIA